MGLIFVLVMTASYNWSKKDTEKIVRDFEEVKISEEEIVLANKFLSVLNDIADVGDIMLFDIEKSGWDKISAIIVEEHETYWVIQYRDRKKDRVEKNINSIYQTGAMAVAEKGTDAHKNLLSAMINSSVKFY